MKDALTLLGDHLADTGATGLEIVDNILGFVQLGTVLKNRETDSIAQRIASPVGGHGIIPVVDQNFIGFDVDSPVSDLGVTIKPDPFSIDTSPDGVPGSVISRSFDITLGRGNRVLLSICYVRCNMQRIGTVR